MPSQRAEQLIEANASFPEGWKMPYKMADRRPRATDPVLVLTCMDPRVVPEQFLGPDAMVAVYRNAGGRANIDAVRSIAVLQALCYNATSSTVMVIHHTDCGAVHLTGDEVKGFLEKHGGAGYENINFGTFPADRIEQSVLEDVAYLENSEILKNVEVRGFVFSTETGELKELTTLK